MLAMNVIELIVQISTVSAFSINSTETVWPSQVQVNNYFGNVPALYVYIISE